MLIEKVLEDYVSQSEIISRFLISQIATMCYKCMDLRKAFDTQYLYNMIKKDWLEIYNRLDIMDTEGYLKSNGFMPMWVQISKHVP